MKSAAVRPIDLVRARASSIDGLDVNRVPRRWERVGDVLLLRIPPDLARMRELIGAAYQDVLGAKTVVEDLAGIHGPWRVPRVRWLAGNGTETVHTEDGIRFKLDVARVMFSSGNMDERMRIARLVHPGETVVDLFAGIGYFAVPIAVRSKPAKVIACEVNPTTFHYLLENTRLNRAGRLEARFGDCRTTAPKGVADRVILGHFDASEYLDTALDAASERATLHIHSIHRSPSRRSDSSIDPTLLRKLEEAANRRGYEIRETRSRFVKWYGPHRRHVVLDADVACE